MKKIAFAVMLLTVGCVGKKGDPGATGIQGLRGPGDIEVFSGAVTSDDFTVTDSRIGSAKEITVYVSAGGSLAELPYYLPGSGTNVFQIITPSTSKIEIFNGVLAGASQYVVVCIL